MERGPRKNKSSVSLGSGMWNGATYLKIAYQNKTTYSCNGVWESALLSGSVCPVQTAVLGWDKSTTG